MELEPSLQDLAGDTNTEIEDMRWNYSRRVCEGRRESTGNNLDGYQTLMHTVVRELPKMQIWLGHWTRELQEHGHLTLFFLWWLIICITRVGHGVSRLNIASVCVCEGVSWWDWHLNQWSLITLPPAMWMSTIQSSKDLNRTITEGEEIASPFLFLPQYLKWNISAHLLLCSDWDLHHLLPWFSGLQTWTKLYHWLFRVTKLQTADCGTPQLS